MRYLILLLVLVFASCGNGSDSHDCMDGSSTLVKRPDGGSSFDLQPDETTPTQDATLAPDEKLPQPEDADPDLMCQVSPRLTCIGVCQGKCLVPLILPEPCDSNCAGTCSGECRENLAMDGSCNGICDGNCAGYCIYPATHFPDGCPGECSGSCCGDVQ